MSLVQAIISNSFILMCADKRITFNSGEISDDFIKIFKLNNNILIGITGNTEDNQKLFRDYIKVNVEKMQLEICNNNISYDEFNSIISKRFEKLNKIATFNVYSMICGWNGVQFVGKTFYTSTGMTDVIPKDKNDVKIISSGDSRHFENFMRIKDHYDFSILGMKNTFKDVLSIGTKFDKSISNNYIFEQLKNKYY